MLYVKLFPKTKRVGMIYDQRNPAGALAEMPFMRKAVQGTGLKFFPVAVTKPDQLKAATRKLIAEKVDVIVIPTNRLVYANLKVVLDIAVPNGVAIVSMNKQGVENGAIAALFADTYNLGRQTAPIARRILKDKVKPSVIGFEYSSRPSIIINLQSAKRIGYRFPSSILGEAAIVIQ